MEMQRCGIAACVLLFVVAALACKEPTAPEGRTLSGLLLEADEQVIDLARDTAEITIADAGSSGSVATPTTEWTVSDTALVSIMSQDSLALLVYPADTTYSLSSDRSAPESPAKKEVTVTADQAGATGELTLTIDSPPTWMNLRPDGKCLFVNETVEAWVDGRDYVGRLEVVKGATFEAVDPAVASIEKKAGDRVVVTAEAAGETRIVANWEAMSDTLEVYVDESPDKHETCPASWPASYRGRTAALAP